MEQLKRYCIDIRQINGKKTYIISQVFLDDVLLDTDLLTSLSASFSKIRMECGLCRDNLIPVFMKD